MSDPLGKTALGRAAIFVDRHKSNPLFYVCVYFPVLTLLSIVALGFFIYCEISEFFFYRFLRKRYYYKQ